MTDLKLAEEIERKGLLFVLNRLPICDLDSVTKQIIAALRRGPERPPSGEMVMVPREPTKAIIMAMNETYWKLAERPKLTQGGNVYVDEYAATIYRAMLSAAEAEGRKS